MEETRFIKYIRGIVKGTDLKFRLEITSPGFSMETDDFEVALIDRMGNVTIHIRKDEMVTDDDGKYLFTFPSGEFLSGLITMRVTAYVPDADFESGTRTEISESVLCEIR